MLGTNVITSGHSSHWTPLVCEGTLSINLGIMKVMSYWIFVILTSYWSYWFPTRKRSHTIAGRKTRQWRRHGRDGAHWRCDLAPGPQNCHCMKNTSPIDKTELTYIYWNSNFPGKKKLHPIVNIKFGRKKNSQMVFFIMHWATNL